jgi:SPOR domain
MNRHIDDPVRSDAAPHNVRELDSLVFSILPEVLYMAERQWSGRFETASLIKKLTESPAAIAVSAQSRSELSKASTALIRLRRLRCVVVAALNEIGQDHPKAALDLLDELLIDFQSGFNDPYDGSIIRLASFLSMRFKSPTMEAWTNLLQSTLSQVETAKKQLDALLDEPQKDTTSLAASKPAENHDQTLVKNLSGSEFFRLLKSMSGVTVLDTNERSFRILFTHAFPYSLLGTENDISIDCFYSGRELLLRSDIPTPITSPKLLEAIANPSGNLIGEFAGNLITPSPMGLMVNAKHVLEGGVTGENIQASVRNFAHTILSLQELLLSLPDHDDEPPQGGEKTQPAGNTWLSRSRTAVRRLRQGQRQNVTLRIPHRQKRAVVLGAIAFGAVASSAIAFVMALTPTSMLVQQSSGNVAPKNGTRKVMLRQVQPTAELLPGKSLPLQAVRTNRVPPSCGISNQPVELNASDGWFREVDRNQILRSFRILVGSYCPTPDSKSAILTAIQTINEQGYPVIVKAADNGYLQLVVGPFSSRDEAGAALSRCKTFFLDSTIFEPSL